ncbi:MAG TPA: hypothetical protein VFM09_00040, partial [Marmoricola sp.]|nr:hypothetical protein [Marmoricola sp.]
MDQGEGPSQLQSALIKGAVALVGLCALVAIGTFVMVKALGLDSGGGGGTPAAALTPEPVTRLPTTALPVPGESSSPTTGARSPSARPHADRRHSRHAPAARGFQLSASPASVRPMQRINLTGTYAKHDNMSIEVQSKQSGHWAPFAGVSASVDLGTFQTYVMSGVRGPNQFRMFDPSTGKASNAVTV